MDNRVWKSGASGTPPSAPASPSVGYPTAGNPALGIEPTKGGEFWFHQLGEEMRAVLVAAGITPSTASNAQLLEAIQRLIDAQSGNYALDTGAANAYVVALSPAITAYTDGMTVRVKAVNANNGACTLNAGAGAPLVNDVGGALLPGDIPAAGIFTATYIAAAAKFYITSLVQSQADTRLQSGSATAFTTGGTSTAFTLTPTPAIAAYAANQQFDVIFHAACGAAATFAISGVATPPTLVRQLPDGTYQTLLANAFPAGWQSRVKLISAGTALVLNLPKRKFSGSFTVNTASASGTQLVTGVGFKPSSIRFHACILFTLRHSIGESVNLVNFCTFQMATGNYYMASRAIYLENAGADYYASVTGYDTDGFTLTTTRVGAPTGTSTVFFTAEE